MSQILEGMSEVVGRGEMTVSEAREVLISWGYTGSQLDVVTANIAAGARTYRRTTWRLARRQAGWAILVLVGTATIAACLAVLGLTSPAVICAAGAAIAMTVALHGAAAMLKLRRRFGRIA